MKTIIAPIFCIFCFFCPALSAPHAQAQICTEVCSEGTLTLQGIADLGCAEEKIKAFAFVLLLGGECHSLLPFLATVLLHSVCYGRHFWYSRHLCFQ